MPPLPLSLKVDLDQSEACLVHLSSLEVDSDQSEACLDDLRGFVDGIGWSDGMVIIGHRYSKSTFGANN